MRTRITTNANTFYAVIDSIQYIAASAITGTIKRTLKEKLYPELGLESLKERRWLRRLCYLYKIVSTKTFLQITNRFQPFT